MIYFLLGLSIGLNCIHIHHVTYFFKNLYERFLGYLYYRKIKLGVVYGLYPQRDMIQETFFEEDYILLFYVKEKGKKYCKIGVIEEVKSPFLSIGRIGQTQKETLNISVFDRVKIYNGSNEKTKRFQFTKDLYDL